MSGHGSLWDAFYPRYDRAQGSFLCKYCGAPESALFQHSEDESTLVCARCGARYDTPYDGPWTFTEVEA